ISSTMPRSAVRRRAGFRWAIESSARVWAISTIFPVATIERESASPRPLRKALDEDARNVCSDHGLLQGTPLYEQCVSREIDARRYREESLPPDESVSSDEAFHYENGFGYDVQG